MLTVVGTSSASMSMVGTSSASMSVVSTSSASDDSDQKMRFCRSLPVGTRQLLVNRTPQSMTDAAPQSGRQRQRVPRSLVDLSGQQGSLILVEYLVCWWSAHICKHLARKNIPR